MFEDMEDDTSTKVKMKLEEYNKMQSRGTLYYELKFLLDSKTAEFFGINVPNLGDYRAKVGENSIDFYTDNVFKKVKVLSEQKKFFHWELEFPQVFFDDEIKKKKDAGFDCIIGNPPYVMIEHIPMDMRKCLYENYALGKRFDIFEAFIEKSLDLLTESCDCSFILPNTFLTGSSFSKLREIILKTTDINKIIDMPQGIFKSVTVDNIIISLTKKKNPNAKHLTQVLRLEPKDNPLKLLEENSQDIFSIKKEMFSTAEKFRMNINFTQENEILFEKIESNSVRLVDETESSQGIILYKTKEDSIRNEYTRFKKKSSQWKKLLRGTNIGRYMIKWGGEYVRYGDWLWSQRNEKFFYNNKIILQALRNKSLSRRLIATFDSEKYYNAHNLANIISKQNSQYSLLYILGIFNSNLTNFWYKSHFPNVNINPNEFRQISIPKIDFGGKSKGKEIEQLVSGFLTKEKSKNDILTYMKLEDSRFFYDLIVKLVEKILEMNSHENKDENLISKIDDLINYCIYKTKNISPQEVEIIEKGLNKY